MYFVFMMADVFLHKDSCAHKYICVRKNNKKKDMLDKKTPI